MADGNGAQKTRAGTTKSQQELQMSKSYIDMVTRTVNRAISLADANKGVFKGKTMMVFKTKILVSVYQNGRSPLLAYLVKDGFKPMACSDDAINAVDAEFNRMQAEAAKKLRRQK